MKKRFLKKWVEFVLVAIIVISIIILGGESDNIKLFLGSKIISLISIISCYYLLLKYGRLQNE